MKKLIIIIPLIMLISGCVVIEERYRMSGPRVETVRYYDYYPSYSHYGFYRDPFYYWMGMSWWNPFWYYGFYNYYYGWYYPHYGSYYYGYYPSRYSRGRDVITKGQLKDPNKTGVSERNIRTIDRKSASRVVKSTSKRSPRTRVIGSKRISRTRTTGRVSRVSSSRGRSIRSTRSSSATRSRSSGSSSKTKKKK